MRAPAKKGARPQLHTQVQLPPTDALSMRCRMNASEQSGPIVIGQELRSPVHFYPGTNVLVRFVSRLELVDPAELLHGPSPPTPHWNSASRQAWAAAEDAASRYAPPGFPHQIPPYGPPLGVPYGGGFANGAPGHAPVPFAAGAPHGGGYRTDAPPGFPQQLPAQQLPAFGGPYVGGYRDPVHPAAPFGGAARFGAAAPFGGGQRANAPGDPRAAGSGNHVSGAGTSRGRRGGRQVRDRANRAAQAAAAPAPAMPSASMPAQPQFRNDFMAMVRSEYFRGNDTLHVSNLGWQAPQGMVKVSQKMQVLETLGVSAPLLASTPRQRSKSMPEN